MNVFVFSLLFIFPHLVIQAKNVLITGGAGFLGSHLCDRKIQEGHHVYCLDRFSGSKKNIAHLLSHPNFTIVQADVTEPIMMEVPLDEIYNFASIVSPQKFQKDPLKTTLTNVLGAHHVLQLAKKTGAKIFQASTSEIYGDLWDHPQQEKDYGNVNPIGIRACYQEGKRCAETLFFDYHRQYGVKIKIGRIFNIYGPRNDGRMVSNFIVQALNNEPITLHGKGEQIKSCCYVDDLIDAVCAFMNTPDEITGPINLGDPQEFTVLEIATKVISLTSSSSSIVYHPLPQDDPRRARPDISLAKEILHWSPKTPLDQGLSETIIYYKKLNN